tara:strand:+ start:3078 stop:3215 length:138 start_codon:yes stop_codon:yes gene_type:complete
MELLTACYRTPKVRKSVVVSYEAAGAYRHAWPSAMVPRDVAVIDQ